MRRTAMTMLVLAGALLPVTAAVSTDAATPDEIPVAITEPIGTIAGVLRTTGASPVLPEPGLIMLVGSGLLGLAAIVRRSTRA